MSLTITIDFHGLCLFVPARANEMYVVMPSTGPKAGDGSVEQHKLHLTYDPNDVLSGDKSGSVEFAGAELALGGFPATGADPYFPKGVVNLTPYAKGKVSSTDHLVANKGKKVEGRVVLPAGKISPFPDRLACWQMVRKENGADIRENREMTDLVTWEIGVENPTGAVTITKNGLDGTRGASLIVFRPELRRLHLHVSHIDPGDKWIPSDGDDEPPHFKAYHWVLHDPKDTRRPRFVSDGKCAGFFKFARKFPLISNTLYSCMVAGAEAE